MRGNTHRLRVLDALHARGRRGITQADFLGPVVDGGQVITRVAARVDELRGLGHVVDAVRDGRQTRYVLIGDRDRQSAGAGDGPASGGPVGAEGGGPVGGVRPPCRYERHRPTDWRGRDGGPVVCGVCHPPAPSVPYAMWGPGR